MPNPHRVLKLQRVALPMTILTALLVGLSASAQAGQTQCPILTNPTSIAIPGTGTSGPALPYPSDLLVAGIPGTVTQVTVTLFNFSHTFPDDVDVLLVGPAGENAIIMSDVGGSFDAVGLTLTLDDSAGSSLPDATVLSSGTFMPTNIGAGDAFAAPAPAPLGGSAFSVFNGTDPNGTWSLYVVDDLGGDSGSFAGGWELDITTTLCITPVELVGFSVD